MSDLSAAPPPAIVEAAPLIDLARPHGEVVRLVSKACEDTGFFQVVGHDISANLMATVLNEARGFFAQPRALKRLLSRSAENPWGYYDRELTKNLRDKKEIFDIGPPPGPLAHTLGGGDPFRSARTPWPPGDDAFQATMQTYGPAAEALARRLLGLVCEGLGVAPDHLEAAFEPASTSFLRLNHYPTQDPLDDQPMLAAPGATLGIHHHTDAGALTVLLQDEIEGLQVWRDDGWRTVAPRDGALVINIGDMVQVWSNDRYRAPVHRVLAMDEVSRLSLPLFYNPSYEASVAPLATCVSAERPASYRPIGWGEFRRRRADGDFADYGAEVQISDYRL